MSPELTTEDKVAAKRLDGLLDYVEALVKLDERPATRLAQHKLVDGSQFILHQHEIAGLPGISADVSDAGRTDLAEARAPPKDATSAGAEDCPPWIDVSNDPTKSPVIHESPYLRLPEDAMNR